MWTSTSCAPCSPASRSALPPSLGSMDPSGLQATSSQRYASLSPLLSPRFPSSASMKWTYCRDPFFPSIRFSQIFCFCSLLCGVIFATQRPPFLPYLVVQIASSTLVFACPSDRGICFVCLHPYACTPSACIHHPYAFLLLFLIVRIAALDPLFSCANLRIGYSTYWLQCFMLDRHAKTCVLRPYL